MIWRWINVFHLEALAIVKVGVHRDPGRPGLQLLHPADLSLLLGLPPPPLDEPDQSPGTPASLPLVRPSLLATAGQVTGLVPRVYQAAVILHWTRGLTETVTDELSPVM